MIPRICTPVTGDTVDIFIKNLNQAQEVSDFVELRADSIRSHVRPADIVEMRKATSAEAIFTFRAREEGGLSLMHEDERHTLLQLALELDFTYIDIEHITAASYQFAKPPHTQVIISSHDFAMTPSFGDLHDLIGEMSSSYLQPAVVKIATTIHTDADLRTIYTTQSSHFQLSPPRADQPLAETFKLLLIGMGDQGRLTRIIGPLLGAPWTYASLPDQTTAPGQLSLEEMKKIYTTLISH